MYQADGFDHCLIGVTELWGVDGFVLVYDVERIVETLMSRDGMTPEEAQEYFEFNIQGAYVGEGTPIYVFPCDMDFIKENLTEVADGDSEE